MESLIATKKTGHDTLRAVCKHVQVALGPWQPIIPTPELSSVFCFT